MKTVLGPSWPKRSDIRLVFIKSDPPGNTGLYLPAEKKKESAF